MFTTCCVTHLLHLVYTGLPLDSLNSPPASRVEGFDGTTALLSRGFTESCKGSP